MICRRLIWSARKRRSLGYRDRRREKALLDRLDYEDGYSLYVGIPFCPTYLHVTVPLAPVSLHGKVGGRRLMWMRLCKEIRNLSERCQKAEEAEIPIYIGGGTPTTLTRSAAGPAAYLYRGTFFLETSAGIYGGGRDGRTALQEETQSATGRITE